MLTCKPLEAGDIEAMLAQVTDDVTLVIDGGAIFHNEMTGKQAMRGVPSRQYRQPASKWN